MSPIRLLDSTFCLDLTHSLGHFLWQGLLIGLLSAAAGWCLEQRSALARYRLHLAALLLMAACVPVTFCWVQGQGQEAPTIAAMTAESETLADGMASAPKEVVETVAFPLPQEIPVPFGSDETVSSSPTIPHAATKTAKSAQAWQSIHWRSLAPYAAAGYWSGVLLMLLRLAVAVGGGQRLRRHAVEADDPALLAAARAQAKRLGLRVTPPLAYCRAIAVPVIAGVIQPMILLPVSLAAGLTIEQINVIVTHELIHVRRHDQLINLLQRIIEAVLFFHPAVWHVSRQITIERENCCDDLVVASGAEPVRYAELLVRIAELTHQAAHHPPVATVAATGGRRSQLRRRVLRLLDPAGQPQVRLTRSGVAALVLILFAGVAAGVLARSWGESADESQASVSQVDGTGTTPPGSQATYDHFLYLRHNETNGLAKTTSLVLARATSDGFDQRDVYSENNLGIGWEPLGAIGGRIYAIRIGDLISIDLASGGTEEICKYVKAHCLAGDHLFVALPGKNETIRIREYDLRRRAERLVASVPRAPPWGMVMEKIPMAVSPDRGHLAFFVSTGEPGVALNYQLRVVDVIDGTITSPGEPIAARRFGTGAGFVTTGPPFAWLDNTTVLVVRDISERSYSEMNVGARGFSGRGGPASMVLATMDVTTGQTRDVVSLPRFQPSIGQPYFRPAGTDGVPRIVVGTLGQYAIDLKAGRLVEDDRVRGDYRYSHGQTPERLYCGRTLLEERQTIPDVAVAPDGRRAIWRTPPNHRARDGHRTELLAHDAASDEVRLVANAWLPGRWSSYPGSFEGTLCWVSSDQLAPADAVEPPTGWTAIASGPYPPPREPREKDTRRQTSDAFTLTLATDRPDYSRYEQVPLTVTLTNKTDREVRFTRPHDHTSFFEITEQAEFADGGGSSSLIDGFEYAAEIFPEDPVVIPAGQCVRYTRLLEPCREGDYSYGGVFSLRTNDWRGKIKAESIAISIRVSPDDDQRLFDEQFDRFLSACQAEFAQDPMTCDHSRFFDLGPRAVPRLIDAVESSTDPEFRKRLGYGLAQMATADVLPYCERLLAGQMEHDRRMLLDSLFHLYQHTTAKDRSLELIHKALAHSKPILRRETAERLKAVYDPRVERAFLDAVDDKDRPTSVLAARYLAAAERKSLADWLTAAIGEPTRARAIAAQSIVGQLEQKWRHDFGDIPTTAWEELARDPAKLDSMKRVLQSWRRWATENPRASDHFFDPDREGWPEIEPPVRPERSEKTAGATWKKGISIAVEKPSASVTR